MAQDELLQDAWVLGEISEVKVAPSGHTYFTLRDERASLSAVLWKQTSFRVRHRPRSGVQMLVHGRLILYPPRGQYQLEVDDLRPFGLGDQHQALEELKTRLRSEGALEDSRKRPLPTFPRRVAVITSASGAAVQDIRSVFAADPFPPEVVLIDSVVQGDQAPDSLARALRSANSLPGVDLILLVRGGGSGEDLWTFNLESVARAILASGLPVVSGVGHESDVTVADLVADARAATPTAAAKLVLELRNQWISRLQQARLRAERQVAQVLRQERRRLEQLRSRPVLARPGEVVDRARQRLDDCLPRLDRAGQLAYAAAEQRLAQTVGRLESLSPLRVLARGYAAVSLPDGTSLSRVGQVSAGDSVDLRLADGRVRCNVASVHPAEPR